MLTNGTGDASAGVGLAVTLGAVRDVPVPLNKTTHHGCDPEPRTSPPAVPGPRAAAACYRETSGEARAAPLADRPQQACNFIEFRGHGHGLRARAELGTGVKEELVLPQQISGGEGEANQDQ